MRYRSHPLCYFLPQYQIRTTNSYPTFSRESDNNFKGNYLFNLTWKHNPLRIICQCISKYYSSLICHPQEFNHCVT